RHDDRAGTPSGKSYQAFLTARRSLRASSLRKPFPTLRGTTVTDAVMTLSPPPVDDARGKTIAFAGLAAETHRKRNGRADRKPNIMGQVTDEGGLRQSRRLRHSDPGASK